ncbi:P1 family peptidase [Halomicroarcula sp. GCM10025817]|uniref:P1 family peptidase n=1 Tax=Haloarcula TaxID=2237 RepID=UPI0023E75E0C|nr:P1 family peptidase [Halomicroarcula sp. SYNS111]
MTANSRPRIREVGVSPGRLPTGTDNSITDVPGVCVGHETVREGAPTDADCVRTGVSVVDPDGDRNVYERPVTGATHVLNGYGKSVGFPQVDELGDIETPIGLTNTLDVWTVADALAGHVVETNEAATSVNPVVGECNDGVLNDIRGRHVTAEHVSRALEAATAANTQEGCVGAGTGTTGFGWKAGIGTASRAVDGHTVGALVLTNTGKPDDLRIDGLHVDAFVDDSTSAVSAGGSIMMLVGTDAALSARKLHRVAKRTDLALGRVGGIAHHGSGDFTIGFANGRGDPVADGDLTPLFRGAIEATEEAIYNSLLRAETTSGLDETTIRAIPEDAVARALANRTASGT